MFLYSVAAFFAFALAWTPVLRPVSASSDHHDGHGHKYFHAMAIISNDRNHSEFQCWRLETPASSIGGIVDIFQFDTVNATYTVYPPRLNSGLHTAPAKQISVYLSGVAHYSLPYADKKDSNSATEEFWVIGGAGGVGLSLDTQGLGHNTEFPTDSSSVALQIPIASLPKHSVVDRTACQFNYGAGQLLEPSMTGSFGWP